MSARDWIDLANGPVRHGVCSGCGVCAGVCPHGALAMCLGELGEYRPALAGVCRACGRCAAVCPFADGAADETALGRALYAGAPGVRHTAATGYVLDTFRGAVSDPRARQASASGGLATWLLQGLLADGTVQAVLAVTPVDEPGRLFAYTVCREAAELERARGSCYYPVTLDAALAEVARTPGRYALVGLPCVCRAVRLAQRQSALLRERLACVIGLVCGQMKSRGFTEYVCALAGGDPRTLARVRFRFKDGRRPASDFGFRFGWRGADGRDQEAVYFRSEGIHRVWSDRLFTPLACLVCDDVFAECADAVFMDAWLPGLSGDPRGHSLALVRDARLLPRFAKAAARPGPVALERIGLRDVIRSQQGVLLSKRGGVRERLALFRREGRPVPARRWGPAPLPAPPGLRAVLAAECRLALASGPAWRRAGGQRAAFEAALRPLQCALDNARRRQRRWRLASAVLRRLGVFDRWSGLREVR